MRNSSGTTKNWNSIARVDSPSTSKRQGMPIRIGRSPRARRSTFMFGLIVAASTSFGPTAKAAERSASAFLKSTSDIAAPDGFSGVCGRLQWMCASQSNGAQVSENDMDAIRKINKRINGQVRYIEDSQQYSVDEYWALPSSRGGDCEDIAMLKMRELISMGIDPARLFLATVLDRKNRNHAVLVLRMASGDYVLDNQTNKIVHWTKTRYSFVRMQNPTSPSRWQKLMVGGVFS